LAGTITVVADARLNRLIAQGTAADIELIESYLRIVDKDNSITSIETHGTSHVINLLHTKASEVAAAIREAYAGRVSAASAVGMPNQPGGLPPGQREAAAAMAARMQRTENQGGERRPPNGRPGRPTSESQEPKMTIAVHEPSNSLIVTAPEALFREVEALAKQIDSRNEQAVDVLQLSNSAQIDFVRQFMTSESASSSGRSTPRPPSPQAPSRSRSGR
jgi:type II secretory pathway component GspD/PulD (secretin)